MAFRLRPPQALRPLQPLRARRARLVSPVFLVVLFSALAYFLSLNAVIPVLPRYVEGPLGGGSAAVGLVMGAFTFTAVLLRPVAGRVGDLRGRRLLMVGGSAVAGLSLVGLLWARSLAPAVALRLLFGVGEACFFVGAITVINDLAPEERRGEAVSLFSLSLYSGVALGPLVGEAIFRAAGFGAVWVVAASLSGLGALLGLLVPETRPQERRGPSPSPPGRLIHRAALLPGTVLATSIFGLSAFVSFVTLYALDLGMGGSGLVFLLYALVVLSIRSLGARIPDLVGARRTATLSLSVSVAGLLVMAGWASPVGLFAGVGLFAVGQALAFPALMTLAVRAAPAWERGSVVGTFSSFFDLAFGVGAVSLGGVASALGFRGTFAGAAAVGAAGLGVLLRTGRRQAGAR